MIGRLAAAAAAALLGSLASLVLLTLFYATGSALRIDFAVDPPRLVSGIYPAERDVATGLTFAWTGADMALRLPGLDRRVPWTVEIRLRGARQPPADNPVLTFSVDGVIVGVEASATDFTTVRLRLPPSAERPRGALLTMQSSTTFVPGPQDPRALGILLDAISVTADGLPLPPRPALAGAAGAGAVFGAALALIGVTAGMAVGAAVLVALGQAAVIARGFGAYTQFPDTAMRLALGIGIALIAIVAILERISRQPLRNTARFAVGFSAAALFLKLLVLLHPDMPPGDALFQAHRFQAVLGGSYYFTSIAPGNYLFPYPPGLYVLATPFADLVRREAGDVVLLRIIVLAADALAGGLLYVTATRGWADRRAGAMATAIYHLMPLDFRVASGGTLTSAFAQSLGVISLALMALPWTGWRLPAVAALTVALVAAYLSHTSTFAVLSVTTMVVAVVFAWRGGVPLRRAAGAVALAGVAAAVIAVAVYYAHFLDTYRTELTRLGSATAAATDAGGRSLAARAGIVPLYLHVYFGVPTLILTAFGASQLWRHHPRNRLTLTLAGWSLSCLAFLALGVLTPLDLRYYVAALPAVALSAAFAASRMWSAPSTRVVVVLLLTWAVGIGIHTWWTTLV